MSHYVYILTSIHWSREGFIKIGITGDVASRLGPYRTSNPGTSEGRPDMYALFRVNDPSSEYNARCVEQCFAMMHGAKKTDNEWYLHMDIEDAVRTIECLECTRIFEIPRAPIERKAYSPAYAGISERTPLQHAHFAALAREQEPFISRIAEFLANPNESAITFIAPCGFGKTRVAIDAIARAGIDSREVAVCAPTLNLCAQWRLEFGGFTTTNMSAQKDIMPMLAQLRVIVFDEAHHMAGVVMPSATSTASDASSAHEKGLRDDNNGATRCLLAHLCAHAQHIKRIFLTFTPRNARRKESTQIQDKYEYLSMDDPSVFGKHLCAPGIRECVTLGILPDYRITAAQCVDFVEGTDPLVAKCAQLAQLFEARDHWSERMYMLRNVLVFVPRIDDIERCARMLETTRESLRKRIVIRAHASGSEESIAKFRELARNPSDRLLVMVSCRVLGEGVDIPEACAVAIMYPKKSPIDITQMVLRAGRWAPRKLSWHMIFPLAQGEDYEGFKHVLSALAVHDSRIIEDATRVRKRGIHIEELTEFANVEEIASVCERSREPLEIFADTFDATNIARITAYFGGIIDSYVARLSSGGKELYETMIRANMIHRIRGRIDYMRALANGTLPIKVSNPPREFAKYWKSWYEFVGLPERTNYPKTMHEFADLCASRGIRNMREYETERAHDLHFEEVTPRDPSEMYGDAFTNFEALIEQSAHVIGRRRVLDKK